MAVPPVQALCAIAIAVAGRLLPHPPNMTPILALSLVSGLVICDRRRALAIPCAALLLSDCVLGFYDLRIMACVYAGLLAPVAAGPFLRRHDRPFVLAGCCLVASSGFFLLSNAGVFLFSAAYPVTPSGLLACYAAALPFFPNTVIGDLLWCAIFCVLYHAGRIITRRDPC